jgi:hypothetical protein
MFKINGYRWIGDGEGIGSIVDGADT